MSVWLRSCRPSSGFGDGVDFRSMPVAVLDRSSRISSSSTNPLIRKRIPTEATSSFAPKNSSLEIHYTPKHGR